MDLNLQNYSTFKVGGRAYRILNIRTENDIFSALAYATKCEKPLIVIGDGSNSIFSDEPELFVIGHMQMKGIYIKEEDEGYSLVRAAAGESWDHLVSHAIENGLSGIEALSGIPGTVGAAPIQNIGAYGTELSDTLVKVSVYDIEHKRFRTFSKEQCELSYRDSIFKKNPGKYIVTEITLRLSKSKPKVPSYASLAGKFPSDDTEAEVTAEQIRKAVLETRTTKLPDPKTIPNCGSFFKNPIISEEQFKTVQAAHPEIPSFETESGDIKLYAGWLIEHADYQSVETDRVGFHDANKLVLINKGGATFEDLITVASFIQKNVFDRFGVEIEPEPNFFV